MESRNESGYKSVYDAQSTKQEKTKK